MSRTCGPRAVGSLTDRPVEALAGEPARPKPDRRERRADDEFERRAEAEKRREAAAKGVAVTAPEPSTGRPGAPASAPAGERGT